MGDVAFTYEMAGVKLKEEDWKDAIEWFMDKFFED